MDTDEEGGIHRQDAKDAKESGKKGFNRMERSDMDMGADVKGPA
jgi:hypothetical protein